MNIATNSSKDRASNRMQQLTTFKPFHTIEPCIWLFVDSTEIGLIVTASPHLRNVTEPRAGKILNFKIWKKG
jgi:hypothetical protein